MILSMTAFGRTERQQSGYSVTLEIRTLNSRFLDVVPRFPKNFLEFEEAVRKEVSKYVRRGRVEVFVQIETLLVEQSAQRIDPLLARYYWEQLQELHRLLPGTDEPKLKHLLSIPRLYESKENLIDRETAGALVLEALAEGLQKIRQMRTQEGETLLRDMIHRLDILGEELSLVESRKDLFLTEYQKRLGERIGELMGGPELDENRLLQEVAVFAERSDITEEIIRIRSHIEHMRSLLTASQPAEGRTLDFITQELHREVNTIGSKASDLEIIQTVVRMKSEIGKLREQVQNIE